MNGARGRIVAASLAVAVGVVVGDASAATTKDIDAKVDATLARLYEDVPPAREIVASAKGVLVFPSVVKAGFGIGGEYGEGALRVDGATVDYYSTTAASVGFQIGAESRSVVLCFTTDAALAAFRKSDGFEIGVDGSVALIESGAGGVIDTDTGREPVVGFIFGRSGLMANVSLEGTKISKIRPE